MKNLRYWILAAAVAVSVTAVAGVMLLGGPATEASDTTATTTASRRPRPRRQRVGRAATSRTSP
jgi:hypothetical protein